MILEGWTTHSDGGFTATVKDVSDHKRRFRKNPLCPKCKEEVKIKDLPASGDRYSGECRSCGAKITVFKENEMTDRVTQQIDELSRKTLASYVKRSSDDVKDKSYSYGSEMVSNGRGERSRIHLKKANKRLRGIAKAVDKLSEANKGDGSFQYQSKLEAAMASLGRYREHDEKARHHDALAISHHASADRIQHEMDHPSKTKSELSKLAKSHDEQRGWAMAHENHARTHDVLAQRHWDDHRRHKRSLGEETQVSEETKKYRDFTYEEQPGKKKRAFNLQRYLDNSKKKMKKSQRSDPSKTPKETPK